MNQGFGSPSYFFYMPMGQWAASLFEPLLPGIAHAGDRIALSMGASLFVGGLGMFHWLSNVTRMRQAALVGVIIYIIAPYHLFVDLYYRMALAEAWGMAFLPWVLAGIKQISIDRTRPLPLIIGSAGLLLSHVPSAMIGAVAASGYAIILLFEKPSVSLAISYVFSASISFLISSFHTITAIQFKYINKSVLFAGRQEPWNWLLGKHAWPDTGMQKVVLALFVGDGTVILILGAIAYRCAGDGRLRRYVMAGWALILASMIIQTPAMAWFWRLQTPLSMIQFPWRTMMLEALALALIGACALAALSKMPGFKIYFTAIATVAIAVVACIDLSLAAYRVKQEKPLSTRSYASIIARLDDDNAYRQGPYEMLSTRFGSRRALTQSGNGQIVIDQWQPRRIALHSNLAKADVITLRQFHFTGWQVSIDGGSAQPAIPGILAAYNAPEGAHRVIAFMPANGFEKMGDLMSIIGVLLAFTWNIKLILSRNKHDKPRKQRI